MTIVFTVCLRGGKICSFAPWDPWLGITWDPQRNPIPMWVKQCWLVVLTILKNMKVSWDYHSKYMEKNMFQTTNQNVINRNMVSTNLFYNLKKNTCFRIQFNMVMTGGCCKWHCFTHINQVFIHYWEWCIPPIYIYLWWNWDDINFINRMILKLSPINHPQ